MTAVTHTQMEVELKRCGEERRECVWCVVTWIWLLCTGRVVLSMLTLGVEVERSLGVRAEGLE